MLKRRLTNSQGIPEMPSVPLLSVLGSGNGGGHAGSPVETVRRKIPDNFNPSSIPSLLSSQDKEGSEGYMGNPKQEQDLQRPGVVGVPRNKACKAVMVCGEGVS